MIRTDTVIISGLSVLTLSTTDKRNLICRRRRFSASVEVQPEGEPLRLLTGAAELEVLGTQFDVPNTHRRIPASRSAGSKSAVSVHAGQDPNAND